VAMIRFDTVIYYTDEFGASSAGHSTSGRDTLLRDDESDCKPLPIGGNRQPNNKAVPTSLQPSSTWRAALTRECDSGKRRCKRGALEQQTLATPASGG
jgi:hypothetical protein